MADTTGTARKTAPKTTIHTRGPAGSGTPNLTGIAGVQPAEPEPQVVSEVERYDTTDRRLAAARIAVAVRRDGDGPDVASHWTVDLPEGTGIERVRVPGTGTDPEPVPSEVDELVRGATRGAALAPAGRVRTVRVVVPLRGGRGAELGRLTVDEIALATFGGTTEVRSWSEARIEVTATGARGRKLADELTGRLAEAGFTPAPPAADAELEQLLRPARRRARTGPKGSAAAVFTAYVAAQVDRLAEEDLRVRRDEPDSVHQLRVASRRLRSALQAYRPLLKRSRTEPVVDALQEFGRALAPARDAEVLDERISAQLRELPDELRLGRVEQLTTRHFARTGQESRAAVLSTLDGEAYAALRASLDRLLEDPPLRADAAGKATKVLPAQIRRTTRRLEQAVLTATDEQAPAADRDEAVHTARKAGKRLRYAVEVARPAVGKPAKRFAKQLKGLQTALGEHQDTVVARDALRELGGLAHAEGENGFAFGILYARDEARAAEIERDLPELFRTAWGKKHRSWIG